MFKKGRMGLSPSLKSKPELCPAGLTLVPEAEAATSFTTQPSLWADSKSLLEPWANVTLTCWARVETPDFQLLKDGVVKNHVHLGLPALEYQFPLGAVTSDNRGLYRCRSGLFPGTWTELSNLLEVTGAEPLPPPQLLVEPVSWITPGLNATLTCSTGLRGVTFLLTRHGDDEFPAVAVVGKNGVAIFSVHLAGNYSCSYQTHTAGRPSEPSATVTIEELAVPPPPVLTFRGWYPEILKPNERVTLVCMAPLSGVEFRLWQRVGNLNKEVLVPMSSTSPDRVFFELNQGNLWDGGPFTCRYRLHGKETTWSTESEPVEVVQSNEKLPAPVLTAEPADLRPAPGSLVRLRCAAPPGVVPRLFALQRQGPGGRRLLRVLRPGQPEADFELRDITAADSANYSCVYLDELPFSGSVPSAPVELHVAGPLPPPQLRALWTGPLRPGSDASLRCQGQVPDVTFELLQEGREEPLDVQRSQDAWAHLALTSVGPQHAGNYSCRYRLQWSDAALSTRSHPVELLVAGVGTKAARSK
ncbi:alpha-1B-glycoprotein [Perognathus longimembris pacificus]|uniref:alpha-1B-glycoprotein n=1 Tax=Perognathus longimembris pacificus TaxID=214514 RepID=UPI0020191E98|nr:alpha-1B-glycoprotein [Perognathus longimembris pacificus]